MEFLVRSIGLTGSDEDWLFDEYELELLETELLKYRQAGEIDLGLELGRVLPIRESGHALDLHPERLEFGRAGQNDPDIGQHSLEVMRIIARMVGVRRPATAPVVEEMGGLVCGEREREAHHCGGVQKKAGGVHGGQNGILALGVHVGAVFLVERAGKSCPLAAKYLVPASVDGVRAGPGLLSQIELLVAFRFHLPAGEESLWEEGSWDLFFSCSGGGSYGEADVNGEVPVWDVNDGVGEKEVVVDIVANLHGEVEEVGRHPGMA